MKFKINTILTISALISAKIAVTAPLNLSEVPLYVGGSIEPNIMVMMDNSASMKGVLYDVSTWLVSTGRTGFDPTIDYYGIFEATTNYLYDSTIPINTTAYSVAIDTTKTGAFHEATCTLGPFTDCWSGRYLNWLTSRRVDVARVALIGGKLESRTAFDYGSGYQYKIVANNEVRDRSYSSKARLSHLHSSVPRSRLVTTASPADANAGAQQSSYDPYAKLEFTNNTIGDPDNLISLNIALVTTTEPVGLLHDVSTDARLGVSFYRFIPNDDDIYTNFTIDAGSLRFKIPNNPFIKKPSASDGGGYRDLEGYIATPIDDIVDAIEHHPHVHGITPLAENLWEVIQYFEQDTPYYPAVSGGVSNFEPADISNPERDPYYYASEGEALSCAKSSVIIVTDGTPATDGNTPAVVSDYDDDSKPGDTDMAGTDDLDDVAYWAFCDKSSGSCMGASQGSRDLRSDLSGDQFLRVHTVSLGGNTIPSVLQDAADNAGGSAYLAEDGAALIAGLTQAFNSAGSTSAASAVALNSGSISSNSRLYQARFDSRDWSGQLFAFPILSDGSLATTPSWDAATLIPSANSRKIITFNDSTGAGVPFKWAAGGISVAQKALLNDDPTVLDYLRGDQSQEAANGGSFRNRSTVLGGIINSAPTFISSPSARYPDNWGASAPENSVPYSVFRAQTRTDVVYVGANDGMYHAFDAATGVEKFAYIPNAVFDELNNLSDPLYTHQYFVDGGSSITDAYFNTDNAWHTVLVSGLGAGGQGIFALDVTDPDFANENAAAANVLWEFTDADDRDLGDTFGQPNIVRLQNGQWAAIFGNGYNNTFDNDSTANDSNTGNAVIYLVDIKDGTLIKKFDTASGIAQDPTGTDRPNGISTTSIVDIDGDSIADAIYAGDFFGNVWKIDISSSTSASWDFKYNTGGSPAPLFTACAEVPCTATNSQAITTQLQVVAHPQFAGYLVYFGTGKYFEVGDATTTAQTTQSFYGIWDRDQPTLISYNRNDLLQQSITNEISAFGFDLRITTEHTVDWATHSGWYIDLINTEGGNTNNSGERQVSNSVIRNGRIIFTTLLPLDDPCGPGGTSWLMELDLSSGARLAFSPFDLDLDGSFSTADYVHIDTNNNGIVDAGELVVSTSGKRSQVGIISTPSIINSTDGAREFKFTNGSSGNIERTVENPGPTFTGRQSWRQLDFNQ